jgi:hypothetical protein
LNILTGEGLRAHEMRAALTLLALVARTVSGKSLPVLCQ